MFSQQSRMTSLTAWSTGAWQERHTTEGGAGVRNTPGTSRQTKQYGTLPVMAEKAVLEYKTLSENRDRESSVEHF